MQRNPRKRKVSKIPIKWLKGNNMADYKKTEKEFVVLAGLAYYTFVHAPQKDDKYGDKYKVDLVVEDEDGKPFIYTNPSTGEIVNMVERVKELGVELKDATASIPGRYLSIRSKSEFTVKNKETGKKEIVEREPIPTVYADKSPVDKNTLIGNGSEVRVQASVKRWTNDEGEKVVSLYFERMIVDKLAAYVNKKNDDEFDFPHMKKKASVAAEEKDTDEVPF